MSVINLATPLSDMLGAALYENVFGGRLPPLIVLSAALTSLVLVLLRFTPITRPPNTYGRAVPMSTSFASATSESTATATR